MGLFSSKNDSKKQKREKVIVFIVEDSKVYAMQLEHFLKQQFAEKVEISIFPVAEVLDAKLAHRDLPDLIIMDYVLNARYDDAESGIEAMKRIRQGYPGIELVLHSAQEGIQMEGHEEFVSKSHFVPKNQEGMEKIAEVIRIIASN